MINELIKIGFRIMLDLIDFNNYGIFQYQFMIP